MKKNKIFKKLFFAITVSLLMVVSACDEEYPVIPDDIQYAELSLSVSDTNLVLDQRFEENELLFNWTPGNNEGSNAPISYKLELDKAGNGFASPVIWDQGKNTLALSVSHGELNGYLLNAFELAPLTTHEMMARVTAFSPEGVFENQVATASFLVEPFDPVSTELYLFGSANPQGEEISAALEMTPVEDQSGVFTYDGELTSGSFRFAVSKDESMTQDFYTRDPADSTLMIYNQGGVGDDLQWDINEGSQYLVTANILEKTISVERSNEPPFSQIWIIGDASPSGWDIETPDAFTQNEENPFIFTYEANFSPGEFKIFAGPLGDWCGEWYRPFEQGQPLDVTDVNQSSGCEEDYKWVITDENKGRYKVILDTRENTIIFERISLYLIGDGGPNGWNIADPEPMDYQDGTFVFEGELGSENPTGEFKFSKFTGDWCDGDWINSAEPSQSLLNTEYIITHGCDGPDNKWKLSDGDAGSYIITINLDNEELTITKQ